MLNSGSHWNRWDPHIHSPGTVLNDQFRGDDSWSQYLDALEAKDPPIRAVGVTDYYLTDNYERVCEFKEAGRLPGIELIFPNVEMRLAVSGKSGFINIHLLVSPHDPRHLEELSRVLERLTFSAFEDRFTCKRADLIRLGRQADPQIQTDTSALKKGAIQFKVNFDNLREVFSDSSWAKENILVAVAGGSGDGTSGLSESGETTLRQEIEKFAHIIFSSNPAQREFWLGERSVSATELRSRYGGLKPCLHGSDAHSHQQVGQPTQDRFSWVKGGLSFDSLRQACIDPATRAYVGPEPPPSTMPSQAISSLTIEEAEWMGTAHIPFNPGLVTVIGARGSGKTALAEMVAAGCDAVPRAVWDGEEGLRSSFLARARNHLGDGTARLAWGGGDSLSRRLDGRDSSEATSFERARYLSQQFVDDLCSATGPTDGLIKEIERVVFEAHAIEARDGTLNFAGLRDTRTLRFRQARAREADAIQKTSARISDEFEKERLVEPLEGQVAHKTKQIDGYTADLAKLVIKGSDAHLKRHQELLSVAQTRRKQVESIKEQRRAFERLKDEVAATRATVAPEMLRQSKALHPTSGMTDEQWRDFLLDYTGPVDEKLSGYLNRADRQVVELTGRRPEASSDGKPYISATEDIKLVKLAILEAEITRLESVLNADKLVRDQYSKLTGRIAQETAAKQTLQERLKDARGATKRRVTLQNERIAAYERTLNAIIAEEQALTQLYAPLEERLQSTEGTLKRLSFSVFRIADAHKWAAYAEEELLDLRLEGPFRGHGALIDKAEKELRPVWETATAREATSAVNEFLSKHLNDFLIHAPVDRDQDAAYRAWLGQFAKWLFGTDHISVRYGIAYDGVDIEKLSPGTRGIVLLLLYLALDDADDRPLIIDQPEENLDPQSVFDELVPLFKIAKTKRQVIMVTHNANLVVNTDADQIIIANASHHVDGGLPRITYSGGGLDEADVRQAVCEILEGGEHAFRERARRLRVRLER